MTDWDEYVFAWACFLGAHVIPAAKGPRGWLIGHLGRRGYLAAFSAVSVVLLLWLVGAAGRAPHVPLWDSGLAGRWLVNLAMPVAILCGCLAAGLSGLVLAFAIWAGAHLVANGDLAHVLLFGGMLAFALTGLARSGVPRSMRITLMRVVVAFGLWSMLIWLHPHVIGASPLPH
ncbi:NnrU family protein [Paracoccus sp. 11-3]|uniref:NnrU family protein n=1 Tax=Paracoccus amoyensis TaxID=2760093 RepID=A0A926GAS6_9RHOB|nr:NnrU family protein [Paracoccus amoyensis]